MEEPDFIDSLVLPSRQKLKGKMLSSLVKRLNMFQYNLKPRGCAQSMRALENDINWILEENKKCILNYLPEKKKTRTVSMPSLKKKTKEVVEKFEPNWRGKSSRRHDKSRYFSPSCKKDKLNDSLPVQFKSTPLHLDPRYVFKKQYCKKERQRIEDVVEGISKKTFRAISTDERRNINQIINSTKELSKNTMLWIDDVHRARQLSKDEQTFEHLLEERQYDHLIDKRLFKISYPESRQLMLRTAKRAIRFRPQGQNGKNLIAKIDSVIGLLAK